MPSPKNTLLRRWYARVMRASTSPRAPHWLAAVSLTESIFFFVPPDALLAPMSLNKPHKALFYATLATITSVLGGVIGYAIGALFYTTIGEPLINLYGIHNAYEQFTQAYQDYGSALVFLGGFTVLPYKAFTITAGVAAFNLPLFIIASLLSRGARFFLVALICAYGAPTIKPFLEKYLEYLIILATLLTLALILPFLL
ncbi:MAG: DedA family protein [Alphaproteobacteria bacterium GM202ARS2]|nr:DedA family protein [Alphaproteobacteria bacterium GM202ARS2]